MVYNDNPLARFVYDITVKDKEIVNEISQSRGNTQKIYSLYRQRLDLYEKAATLPIDILYQSILLNMLEIIKAEMLTFKTRLEFEEEVANLYSKMEQMAEDIRILKEKKE